jgi:predicted nucleotidyltransferase
MCQYPGHIAAREHDGAVPLSSLTPLKAGERALMHAVELARTVWGQRLVAAYALGSLAHGGFSIHVSDVDLGLVLGDPLDERDAKAVDRLLTEVKAGGVPLAERLSVYWGSLGTLSGSASGGRFPPLDLHDLKQFGRLLAGRDVRSQLRSPTLRELVVSGAQFALKRLSTSAVAAQLRNPGEFAKANTKTLTKLVLYPVRFLFTARTGQIGMNDEAVNYFSTVADGPVAELARKGLEWRFEPPDPSDRAVVELLRNGVLPLYRMFLADYERRLSEYGESELAQAYREWRERLE